MHLFYYLSKKTDFFLVFSPKELTPERVKKNSYNHFSSAGTCSKMGVAVCLPNALIPAAEDLSSPRKMSWEVMDSESFF